MANGPNPLNYSPQSVFLRLKESVKPISYIKAHASEAIRDVVNNNKTMVITQNVEAWVILQDIKTYDKTKESLALLKILAVSGKNLRRKKAKPIAKSYNDVRKSMKDNRKY